MVYKVHHARSGGVLHGARPRGLMIYQTHKHTHTHIDAYIPQM
jgi:hypothetical protein